MMAALVQLFVAWDDWGWVAHSVRQMFEEAAPGDNFTLGLAGDPNKNMAQTRRLRDEAGKYQQL